MPRILLADDHFKVRCRVRDALQRRLGWEVCAEASNGREAVEMTAAHQPDIAVLDLSMPELKRFAKPLGKYGPGFLKPWLRILDHAQS